MGCSMVLSSVVLQFGGFSQIDRVAVDPSALFAQIIDICLYTVSPGLINDLYQLICVF